MSVPTRRSVALSPFFSVAYGLLELTNEALGVDFDSAEPYNWSREASGASSGVDGMDGNNIISGGAKRATRVRAAPAAGASRRAVAIEESSEEEDDDESEDDGSFVE